MKQAFFGLLVLCFGTLPGAAHALESGKPAPEFTATTSDGKTVKLSDFKGKNVVVLEWTNHGCPFVKRHYESKNMQDLQKKYTGKGMDVKWFSVISSAPGAQGYVSAADAEKDRKKFGANPTGIILDPKGELGHKFGAITTPHMFVISKDGTLVYQGAIDEKADAKLEETKGVRNFVSEALDSTLAGKAVKTSQHTPYGCGVKYN